jgi:hypothetical protein
MMSVKPKKLALMLTIGTILLSLTLTNIKIVGSNSTGGEIDLFTQKEPYSGKGQNMPSDAFALGEEVQIYASATYNDYPVEGLLVAFQVLGPRNPVENISFYRVAYTNQTGVAMISFRISNFNESTSGEWIVVGNARIGDLTYADTVTFKADWIVQIVSLKTVNENHIEQAEFSRASYVGIELIIRNIAMVEKIATITVTIHDYLDTFLNATELNDFAVQPNGTFVYVYFFLYIPKSAYIGSATVYSCAYTALPTYNGVPYCPEVSKNFLIASARYFLNVKTEPALVITIQGEGWYEENTNVSLTAPLTIEVSNGARWGFCYWDVDGFSMGEGVNLVNVVMDANHTATAHYIPQYYLSVNTDPIGITTIQGEDWYDESSNVTLNASAVSDYDFGYWDVNGVSQGTGVESITVYMNVPQNATAHYTRTPSGLFIPSWFFWPFLPLLILIILLLIILFFYSRRRRKKAEASFYSGWTAWFYGYDLRNRNMRFRRK